MEENQVINDIINNTIEDLPYPPLHATAYTKEEVIALLNKDRSNIKWACAGKIRNKYAK